MAQDCSQQSLPLSSILLAQHQKNQKQLNSARNSRYNNHFQYSCQDIDASSVSSFGGEYLHQTDSTSPPKSPVLTPVINSHKRSEGVSSMLIQDAFSSLSLADKCALSVSLGSTLHQTNNGNGNSNSHSDGNSNINNNYYYNYDNNNYCSNNSNSNSSSNNNTNNYNTGLLNGMGIVRKLSSSSCGSKDSLISTCSNTTGVIAALEMVTGENEQRGRIRGRGRACVTDRESSQSYSMNEEQSFCSDSYLSPRTQFLRSHSMSFNGGERGERGERGSSSGCNIDYNSNCYESMSIRSVISESDKESLDVAMSMMRQQELDQVEDEVRKIQNNVRGWLLRKNYVNLRDAAKTLQVAWRGKKRSLVKHRVIKERLERKNNDLTYRLNENENEGELGLGSELNSENPSIIVEEDDDTSPPSGFLSLSSSSTSSFNQTAMAISPSFSLEFTSENVLYDETAMIEGGDGGDPFIVSKDNSRGSRNGNNNNNNNNNSNNNNNNNNNSNNNNDNNNNNNNDDNNNNNNNNSNNSNNSNSNNNNNNNSNNNDNNLTNNKNDYSDNCLFHSPSLSAFFFSTLLFFSFLFHSFTRLSATSLIFSSFLASSLLSSFILLPFVLSCSLLVSSRLFHPLLFSSVLSSPLLSSTLLSSYSHFLLHSSSPHHLL